MLLCVFLFVLSSELLLFSFSLKHDAFMLGTSNAKHDKEGFDLFITTAPIPDLNEKLNVFGRVVQGEDVVQVNELTGVFICLLHSGK